MLKFGDPCRVVTDSLSLKNERKCFDKLVLHIIVLPRNITLLNGEKKSWMGYLLAFEWISKFVLPNWDFSCNKVEWGGLVKYFSVNSEYMSECFRSYDFDCPM